METGLKNGKLQEGKWACSCGKLLPIFKQGGALAGQQEHHIDTCLNNL
jgi:hypothetical protein